MDSLDRREALRALRADPRFLAVAPRSDAGKPPNPDVLALVAGLPTGGIISLEGDRASGRGVAAAALLARATRHGLAAVLDDGGLHPPSLAASGVDLDRLLVVDVRTPLETARVADIILRSGAFALIMLPCAHLVPAAWRRIAILARRTRTALLAPAIDNADASVLSTVATLRLACTVERILWLGRSGCWNQLAGYDVTVRALGKFAASSAPVLLRARIEAPPLFAKPEVSVPRRSTRHREATRNVRVG